MPVLLGAGRIDLPLCQEELQDSETFSSKCNPPAASYLVFFFSEASSSSASRLMLPKTPVILRSQLQDVVMDKKAQGEVCGKG